MHGNEEQKNCPKTFLSIQKNKLFCVKFIVLFVFMILSPLLCVLVCFSSWFVGQFPKNKKTNPSSFSSSFLLYHHTLVVSCFTPLPLEKAASVCLSSFLSQNICKWFRSPVDHNPYFAYTNTVYLKGPILILHI